MKREEGYLAQNSKAYQKLKGRHSSVDTGKAQKGR